MWEGPGAEGTTRGRVLGGWVLGGGHKAGWESGGGWARGHVGMIVGGGCWGGRGWGHWGREYCFPWGQENNIIVLGGSWCSVRSTKIPTML